MHTWVVVVAIVCLPHPDSTFSAKGAESLGGGGNHCVLIGCLCTHPTWGVVCVGGGGGGLPAMRWMHASKRRYLDKFCSKFKSAIN